MTLSNNVGGLKPSTLWKLTVRGCDHIQIRAEGSTSSSVVENYIEGMHITRFVHAVVESTTNASTARVLTYLQLVDLFKNCSDKLG